MGRQYNYYISPEEDLDFMKELVSKGFLILEHQKNIKNNIILCNWKVLQLDDIVMGDSRGILLPYMTHIYKKEWGELKTGQETYSNLRKKCPIIEHVHCKINTEYNMLTRGRFWIDTYYRGEMESFDTLYKEFQKVVRMMKKRIVYKGYKFENSQETTYPLSQQAVDLIKSGYKIGG